MSLFIISTDRIIDDLVVDDLWEIYKGPELNVIFQEQLDFVLQGETFLMNVWEVVFDPDGQIPEGLISQVLPSSAILLYNIANNNIPGVRHVLIVPMIDPNTPVVTEELFGLDNRSIRERGGGNTVAVESDVPGERSMIIRYDITNCMKSDGKSDGYVTFTNDQNTGSTVCVSMPRFVILYHELAHCQYPNRPAGDETELLVIVDENLLRQEHNPRLCERTTLLEGCFNLLNQQGRCQSNPNTSSAPGENLQEETQCPPGQTRKDGCATKCAVILIMLVSPLLLYYLGAIIS